MTATKTPAVKTAQSTPKKMTPEEFGQLADKNFREVRVAIGNMIKNGYLTDPDVLGKLLESYANLCNREYKIAATTPKSQIKCLLMAYHSKLDILGHPAGCYFVPYTPKKGGRKYLQFQVSYHGLLSLIYESKSISQIVPRIVLKGDWLEEEMIDGDISINWRPDQKDRLDLKEYKGVIITIYHNVGDKLHPTSQFVPAADIEKRREKSQTLNEEGRPQHDWGKEMILKTAFKIATKFADIYGKRAAQAILWDSWGMAGKGDVNLETGQIVEKDIGTAFHPTKQSLETKARVAQAVEGEMIYDADTGEPSREN